VAGLADVVLRGLLLTCTCLAVGGVAWVGLVLRVEPHAKPAGQTSRALRLVAIAALLAAAAQAAVLGVTLAALTARLDAVPLASFLGSGFAGAALGRIGLALGLGVVAAYLATRPGSLAAWAALGGLAVGLGATGAALSHAAARLEGRGVLFALDAVHLLAVAAWVGGLGHLVRHAWAPRDEPAPRDHEVARRFSALALAAVSTLVVTGVLLTVLYVGEPGALVGTAYGVMILTKAALLLAVLPLAYVNFRLVRRATGRWPFSAWPRSCSSAATPGPGRWGRRASGRACCFPTYSSTGPSSCSSSPSASSSGWSGRRACPGSRGATSSPSSVRWAGPCC
jgi:putative copper export protein